MTKTIFGSRDIARQIQAMKPGQCVRVSQGTMRLLSDPIMENHYRFPIKDWILEHIVGASFEFGYHEDLATGDINYFRLPQPLTDGRRSYVSPDRRDRFRKRFDGIYEPIGEPT